MSSKRPPVLRTRRNFLRQAACATLGTAALTATLRDLRFINAAMAQSNLTGYRALVCLFLNGGNDANNLVVPTLTSEYNNYATLRGPGLALPQSSLLPITPLNTDGHNYGLHPCCRELQTLFAESKLALLFNTGTLAFPLTRAQFLAGSVPLPLQLFSHADQTAQWQTSLPDRPSSTGWGGRCADLLAAVQTNAPVSLAISLADANTFEVGNITSQYSVSTSGAITLNWVDGTKQTTLTNLLGLAYPNMQALAYSKVAAHALSTSSVLNTALQATAASNYWTVPFPTTVTTPTSDYRFSSSLAGQLQMIARLIEAGHRSTANGGFGMSRQIFFCQVGGYDLHAGQTYGPSNTTIGSHADLLAELSQNLLAFQRAMEQLGLSNNVTTFTASEFGRTFSANGNGSDHGWGGHHFILGGAVHGQRTYGTFPTLTINGPDDTYLGRWIPTTAVDQYFATLATWFGVDAGNLATVFPNLGRFASSNLGFV